MMKQMNLFKSFFNQFFLCIKRALEEPIKVVILSMIVLIWCITKCHKINLKRDRSYINSPDWIKNKEATRNPVNDNIKCFPYAITFSLNHEEIGKKFTKNVKN